MELTDYSEILLGVKKTRDVSERVLRQLRDPDSVAEEKDKEMFFSSEVLELT